MANLEKLIQSTKALNTDIEGFTPWVTGDNLPTEEAFREGQAAIVQLEAAPKAAFRAAIKTIFEPETAVPAILNQLQTQFTLGAEIPQQQQAEFHQLIGAGLDQLLPRNIVDMRKVIMASEAHQNWQAEVGTTMKAAQRRSVLLLIFEPKLQGLQMLHTSMQLKEQTSSNPGWEVLKEPSEIPLPTILEPATVETAISRVMCLIKP